MADSFVSKLITELTAKTTASDTDLVPIADSSGNFFKMTFAKLKELITSELNTKILYTSDISTISDSDYLVISKMPGYRLINAYNGDYDSAPYARIVAIAKQGDYYALSFQSTISYTIRIEKIWMKE